MIKIPKEFRIPIIFSVCLHLAILLLICSDNSSKNAVLEQQNKNTQGLMQPSVKETEIVQAVSVDNDKFAQTVAKLKKERELQQQAEINKQKSLERQALMAKEQRVKEEQRLQQLKEEANKIAILHKKQALEEKKRLKELAEQKAVEAKRLQELKAEKEKLLKQELEEKLSRQRAEQLKLEQAKARQEKLDRERQAQDAHRARENAESQARLAGVVDKYKALILSAVRRNWILHENVDNSLSSQFRIRLAPDGTVLEVSLTRASGDPLLDRSAQAAIYKSSPLPVPADAEAFNVFRDISFTFRPEQVRG